MAKHIQLPQDKKTELEQLIKSGEHNARVISRARVLLLLDRSQGQKRTLAQVAEAALLSTVSVSHIKRRYFDGDLDRALYDRPRPVSYTHLRAHETVLDLVCRLLLEKKNTINLLTTTISHIISDTNSHMQNL